MGGFHLLVKSLLKYVLLIHPAGEDFPAVLVFPAGIKLIFPQDIVKIDLADFNIRINPDGLDTENLQSPAAGESDIAEAGRNMDEQSQPPGGGTPLQHGDKAVRPGEFIGAAQIEPVWLQQQAIFWDLNFLGRIEDFHIQFPVFIYQQFVMEGEVVAVGVELLGAEGINENFFSHPAGDFFS